MLDVGGALPGLSLADHRGGVVDLSTLGKAVIWFYPAAMTPGCTKEACDFRDAKDVLSEAGFAIFGVSPDAPAENAEFAKQENLTYLLLSDENHAFAELMGAWGMKKNYGREYTGLIRSTFITNEDGVITHAFRNVKATGHGARILKELGI